MGRFYEVLKEAARTRQLPTEKATSPEPDQLAETERAPLQSTSAAAVPTGQSVAGGLPEAVLQMESAVLGPGVALAPGRVAAVETHLVMDERARLIPHTADSAIVEHYRRLRVKILQQQEAKPFRTLVVTSPNPQEGKTVTILNLGISFGKLPDYKVLVVDGDLRRGSIGKWLGVAERPGLGNLLDGSAQLEDVVLKCDELPMHFMVRGTLTTSPGELLHAPNFLSTFRRLGELYDLVLVDSPPVNLLMDVQQLAASCEAVLLVARAYSTRRKALQQAAQDLSGARIIGTVLNAGIRSHIYRPYGAYLSERK